MSLTNRMTSWLEALGAHIAVTDADGTPFIVVSDSVKIKENVIEAKIGPVQAEKISHLLKDSTIAAVAPGGLGAIRAPYQFKGRAVLSGDILSVKADEIYCTKPGPEAGIRLDVLKQEALEEFDESRWQDLPPKEA